MKILLLTSRFPFPPIGGDKLRFFNILKYLGKNHETSILCFTDRKVMPDMVSHYKSYFNEIDVVYLPKVFSYVNCIFGLLKGQPLQISYYKSKKMERLVKEKLSQNKFDMVFVHLIRMAEYVKNYPIYKILDMTDAQSLNYIRAMAYTTGKWSIIHRFEKDLVRNYEQHIWRYFNKTYVVSPVDREYLKTLNKDINVEVLANGVDIEKYQFRLNNHRNSQICFIGNMRTFPNTDAVVWFSKEIFPLIKEEIPDTKFFIIGAEPSRRVRELSKMTDVIVTGEIKEINQYVWDSAVSVAPIRVGAGIQNKILESMALGTPVVTTSIGLEGIEAKPGKHLLVADTPEEFARKVVQLIKDRDLRMQISQKARSLIEEKYTWENTLRALNIL
uniref:TIGR03087 family PEP-CTERM/XrtA system glycosyltransferase n=1 Tax=candidate division WOR-3 bacterium TaxID=2052148 RepID=A0A7C4XG31_UNCW3